MADGDNDSGVRELSDRGSDGTRLGSSTTDLIAFWGSTPVNKPAATADLKDALVEMGLITDSGASNLNLDGGDITCDGITATSISVSGLASFASNIAITASGDLTVDAVTATSLGVSGIATITDQTITNDLTISDAGNVILAATTGTKVGTATTQKLGFWNVTPVVQPAAAAQAAVTATGGATGLSSATVASIHSLANDNKTLVNAIRTALVNTGIMKGAA